MRKSLTIAAVALLGAIGGVLGLQAATAATPSIVHFGPNQWTGITLNAGTLCPFPVLFSGTQEGTMRTFYESDGTTIAMRVTDGTEQDTFSANGKTLVGDEYHFNFRSVFDNGVRVAYYSNGPAERVHLPDGGVFIITGHDLITGSAVWAVDSGNSGNNLAAFCAALS
jgi:hypothetical protein